MMNTLYVIGNGFDLCHNLPTRWCHFYKFVKANYEELYFELEKYFEFRISEVDSNDIDCNENDLWKYFEEDLGTFNYKVFYNNICNIDIEYFKPSFVFGLEDDIEQQSENLLESIRKAFEDWLECIDLDLTQRKLDLNENACFLSFNYTLVLQQIYKIKSENILHVHGNIEDNRGSIIYGHNQILEEVSELDENGDSNRTPFSDSEAMAKYPFHALSKPVLEITQDNKKFFEILLAVNEIIVLGHSLNEIDIPYFKEIHEVTSSANWKVSYYTENERQSHLSKLQDIGINGNSISMIKIEDLVIV